MKKTALIVALMAIFVIPSMSCAKKTTYIVTNKRLNYVKIVEVKASEAEEHNMTHPADISEAKMREILKSLKLSKAHLIGDKIDTREIYDERAINFLAPALSRAFRDAQPNEEIQFSYVVKNPYFIIRNDRLTMVDAWVSGNELFLDFKKLYAKLTGDTDKRGNTSKIVSRAKGLRVSLELGPGQNMAAVGSRTMVVNLDYKPAPTASSAADTTVVETSKDGVKRSTRTHTRTSETVAKASTTPTPATATASSSSYATETPAPDSITRRLEKLDMLRKRNLISSKEYKAKKAEILNEL